MIHLTIQCAFALLLGLIVIINHRKKKEGRLDDEKVKNISFHNDKFFMRDENKGTEYFNRETTQITDSDIPKKTRDISPPESEISIQKIKSINLTSNYIGAVAVEEKQQLWENVNKTSIY